MCYPYSGSVIALLEGLDAFEDITRREPVFPFAVDMLVCFLHGHPIVFSPLSSLQAALRSIAQDKREALKKLQEVRLLHPRSSSLLVWRLL